MSRHGGANRIQGFELQEFYNLLSPANLLTVPVSIIERVQLQVHRQLPCYDFAPTV